MPQQASQIAPVDRQPDIDKRAGSRTSSRPGSRASTTTRRDLVRTTTFGSIAIAGSMLIPASALAHEHATPEAPPTADEVALGQAPPLAGVTGEPLRVVPTQESVDGVLDITLVADVYEMTVAGKTVRSTGYSANFPSPTWVVDPGDTIRVHLTNKLKEVTNLHVHGFHVSPRDNGDNVFIEIKPGETFDYEYQLPDTHPSGIYWFHPHPHGISDQQVTSGMVGSILIRGGLDKVQGIEGLKEQSLFIQSIQFAEDGRQVPLKVLTGTKKMRLVNGQLQPNISIQPGETQRWRISNCSGDNFCLLSLAGHKFFQIAKDGNPFNKVVARDQILLAPAERVEVLIQAETKPGTRELRQLQWGGIEQIEPDVLIATMVIEGDPVATSPLPDQMIPYPDLRNLPIDKERVVVFSPAPPPYYQWIDGRPFDPDHIDQKIKLGAVERWTIQNTTDDVHPFHIHINDFQVIEINGESIDAPSVEDTISIPAHGEVTFLTRFEDFDGKYVFHCHILMHEDAGMMAIVEVSV